MNRLIKFAYFLLHSASQACNMLLSNNKSKITEVCSKLAQAPAQYQRSQTCKVVNQAVSQAAPHDQPSAAVRTTLTLSTALGLYSLTDSELFWELQRDTRCLLGWNQNRIVVAFRGTASTTNVWSDLQVAPCCAQDC